MEHKVNSVGDLHRSAVSLFNNMVVGTNPSSAAMMQQNLREGIEALKNSWEGMDAGTQINNVVTVYNGIVGIKNLLASLSAETSKIAADYRGIQIANGAKIEELVKIREQEAEPFMPEYTDTRDTVNITQAAVNGKNKIDAANGAMDEFIAKVKTSFNEIMQNWVAGPSRNEAQQAFDDFMSKVPRYKQTLEEVSKSVTTALQNYGM